MSLTSHTPRHTPMHGDFSYAATLLAAGVVFYALLHFTTLKPDDMLYSYIIGSDYTPISSLADFFRSIPNFYVEENGRMANFLTQLFSGLLGKDLFNVAGTLVFVWFLHLTTMLTGGRHRVAAVLATLLVMLVAVPFPGETLLWMCGSINYLWAATFSLALLWWLMRQDGKPLDTRYLPIVAVAAFVAGDMNETVTMPMLFAAVMWHIANRRKPSRTAAVAFIAYALGAVTIVCSPGAWTRLSNTGLHASGPVAQMLLDRLQLVATKTVRYILPALALVALAAKWFRNGGKAVLRSPFTWLLAGCILLIFVVGNPKNARIYFFYVVTGYIVTARLLMPLLDRAKRWQRLTAAAAMALACLCLAATALRQVVAYKHFNDAVEAQIKTAPLNCVLPAGNGPTGRWVASNCYDSESDGTPHHTMVHFYHKTHIAFLRDSLMARYRQDDFLEDALPVNMRSSLPQVAKRVWIFPRQTYSAIAIDSACIDQQNMNIVFNLNPTRNRNNGKMPPGAKFYYTWHIGVQNHMTCFNITTPNGKSYLILPAVEEDVDHLEIPVLVGGKSERLVLDRQ